MSSESKTIDEMAEQGAQIAAGKNPCMESTSTPGRSRSSQETKESRVTSEILSCLTDLSEKITALGKSSRKADEGFEGNLEELKKLLAKWEKDFGPDSLAVMLDERLDLVFNQRLMELERRLSGVNVSGRSRIVTVLLILYGAALLLMSGLSLYLLVKGGF